MFTGGGTVGHVTLNLLLIPKFIEDGWEVHYIGDKKGIEYQEIKKSGLDVRFHSIATGKLRRYFSFQNMMDVFKVAWGTLQSIAILLRVRPQVLFSKGGFVSVPPVIAARLTRVPVYIHESDLSMGLANKIAYKFATKMYTTFEQAHGLTKSAHIGAVTKVTDHIPTTSEVLEEKTQGFNSNDYLKLFRHIQGNQMLYRTYFKLGYDNQYQIRYYDTKQAIKYFDNKHIEYHITFFQSGFNAIVKMWLAGGCKETPEEMNEIIRSEYQGRLSV